MILVHCSLPWNFFYTFWLNNLLILYLKSETALGDHRTVNTETVTNDCSLCGFFFYSFWIVFQEARRIKALR